MKRIPDKFIDLILCDLPYGTTQNKWDSVIPFDALWQQYRRIAKDNAAIVLFGSEPFSSLLRCSNLHSFKYDWVWEKTRGSGHLNAKKMPMKSHETISVFYKSQPTYNPQGLVSGVFNNDRPVKSSGRSTELFGAETAIKEPATVGGYPLTVLKFAKDAYGKQSLHPTQKPVALMEYLIRTYTNEGDKVLDNCMGSGTTGVACANTNRHFIGMEMNAEYFAIAKDRIEAANNTKESV
jgi:site-specific DNA-methyltransferase (adenine-specific)